MLRTPTPSAALRRIFLLLAAVSATATAAGGAELKLEKGDHICLVGNTLAERMQYFGHFETLLHSRFPELELVVRNLGWSADTVTLRPRSQDFGSPDDHLRQNQADVILAFFGFNESFAGPPGLARFEQDLDKWVQQTLGQQYNGKSPPRIVLCSPIAHENMHDRNLPDSAANNANLELYTSAIARVAAKHKLPYADLFAPTRVLFEKSAQRLTINGIHLSDEGYRQLAPLLDAALFGAPAARSKGDALYAAVQEKNLQFFHHYRAVNGFYIYGGRKSPFGVVNFPPEREKLLAMVANRDRRIWDLAQGKAPSGPIDDTNTGQLSAIPTNHNRPVNYLAPEQARQTFQVAAGYDVNLFASEVEFPELRNPCQFTFDRQGRLWVCVMPVYPQYLPGGPINDKVLILEDTDGDGRADKCTVFADGLHVPTGIELGNGGVYVAQQPNLMFLKDTDGDGRADVRELVLHGFDSADSHHSISAFTWGPGGELYFQEGTFHHSQIETPYGPVRLKNAGVFRYEPRTAKLDVFVSYSFANPWGHIFDRWGQNFVADASNGANYVGAAFSGWVDYDRKHPELKQFLTKRVRPTSGCEIVSSRHFPDEAQGNYLLNNCIGFQGVLQHRMQDDGSGFAAKEIEPLLVSSDPNFRPTALQFGPDGALYVCDWYNALIGHMQHSIRDPNRDTEHGRIWRITAKGRPLVKPPKIVGEPIEVLLELLKTYEDRTRYHVRLELGERPTDDVLAAVAKWTAALDKDDREHEHHLLEALWVQQHHNAVSQELLKRLLRSPDYRARAAATRVLCYVRDQVSDPLALLRPQVNDEHPRVRLEAVRACSFFKGEQVAPAMELALESLNHDQDYYLEYAFKETMATLERLEKKK